MIFFAMLGLGTLLGLAGAGGAGLMITTLTVGFNIPIHTALGVALASMGFSVCSGAISHIREGNVLLKIGIPTGLAGMAGSFLGAQVSHGLPDGLLHNATGTMIMASALLLYITLFQRDRLNGFIETHASAAAGKKFYAYAISLGLINGFLSGAFGIGATAFIQLSLMLFFGISLYHSIGTTMFVILPIAISGGLGYIYNGHLDMNIFVQTFAGLTIGSYGGAKLTRLINKNLLRYILLAMPTIGGIIMLSH